MLIRMWCYEKKAYKRPSLQEGNTEHGLIPIVAVIASALGVSHAVAGLGLGGSGRIRRSGSCYKSIWRG